MLRELQCQDCPNTFQAVRNDLVRCADCAKKRHASQHARYEKRDKSPCPQCGKLMARRSKFCLPCGHKARKGTQAGELNRNWKGGRSKFGEYMGVRVRPGTGSTAYQLEHRYVWEQANGKIPQGWVVHHLNGVKLDNRLENLTAMPRHEHHSHPREALKPYEARIRELETQLRSNQHAH